MSETTTLRRKLFLAGQEAEAVEKNGEGDGFKYAKATDVIAEASRVLEKQGLVVIPSVEDVQLRFGKTGALATVSMTFEICDSESEETLTKAWSGTGWDFPGDKAIYAAITGAKKYFLGSLLDIPFGVDPEEDTEPDDEGSAEALQIAAEQDRAAEQPDLRPVPDQAVAEVAD
jgi:hypothetical protein